MHRSPREKALVWIVRPSALGPEVLLLERPKKRGGGLHPVTGKADGGETPEASALREAHEETKITGPLSSLNFAHGYEDARRGPMREHAFLLRAEAGAEPTISDEHIAFRWVRSDEADALLEWPAHRQSLRLALIAWTRKPHIHGGKK